MTQIKRSAGCSSEEVEMSGAVALRDFLQALGARHGAAFRAMLLDDAGEPRRSLLFFVGEEHAELSRPLRDGDAITILAPMSGG
ncbi:MAG: MoaD/ThiS family protein [Planctomycetes bacterium]|nr:MoaD/ThiS family protein [Planctomycetota bacterium]